jgi:hypothetical protein
MTILTVISSSLQGELIPDESDEGDLPDWQWPPRPMTVSFLFVIKITESVDREIALRQWLKYLYLLLWAFKELYLGFKIWEISVRLFVLYNGLKILTTLLIVLQLECNVNFAF